MLEDPVRFNDAVVRFFRTKYGIYTKQVLKELRRHSRRRKWLRDLLDLASWRKVERHFFPVFATASILGGVTPNHVTFCSAYARAVSLPVLGIDRLIDRPEFEQTQTRSAYKDLLSYWCSNYDGIRDLIRLPNGQRVLDLVSSNYYDVFCSLFEDLLSRYDDSLLSRPERTLASFFRSPHSQLTCKYFAVTVQASFLISSQDIDSNTIAFSESFGRIRQLIDEVADVSEDLKMGKVTLPVLFCLARDDSRYKSAILDLWKKVRYGGDSALVIGALNRIKQMTISLGGYERAYALADMWCRDAIGSMASCMELRILLRLKRAYLERLKINDWADMPDYY